MGEVLTTAGVVLTTVGVVRKFCARFAQHFTLDLPPPRQTLDPPLALIHVYVPYPKTVQARLLLRLIMCLISHQRTVLKQQQNLIKGLLWAALCHYTAP